MKNLKKKGFTIVELVIVIAVIAVLAAVLIPTFVNLTRKANISADTVLAKNLNTALAVYDAENDVEDFDDVLEAIKEHGYLIANLNAKAEGCYFVWESETNQILLVDSTEDYVVLYSTKDGYATPDASWYFAISNKEKADAVKAKYSLANVKLTIASTEDLKEILAAGGEFYMDESVVLDKDNLLTFDSADKTVTVNLGNSSLNTTGILKEDGDGIIPVEVKQGNVTFNGGSISTAGENLNYHGLKVSYALQTSTGTNCTFNDTYFNLTNYGSQIRIFGTAVLENVVIDATKSGIETRYNGNITLRNTTINSDGGSEWYGCCFWACNFDSKNEAGSGHIGTATITIESGTYNSEKCLPSYGNVVACGGKVVIKGGNFTSPATQMFAIAANGSIEITGGTFNGIKFDDLSVAILEGMTATGTVTETANGYLISK